MEELMPELEPDELAYKIDDRYFAIQRTEEGYDYTFYALDYHEMMEGAYDNPDISMRMKWKIFWKMKICPWKTQKSLIMKN